MEKLLFTTEVEINASLEKVWNALVDRAITPKYMFGCEALSDWEIGSPLTWRSISDGVDYVTGKVLAFEPPSKLSYTTFNPFSGEPDIPENHLTGTYLLEKTDTGVKLTIIQGDFNNVANSQARYEEAINSWEMMLPEFRKVFE